MKIESLEEMEAMLEGLDPETRARVVKGALADLEYELARLREVRDAILRRQLELREKRPGLYPEPGEFIPDDAA
jgi:hypothetical protein